LPTVLSYIFVLIFSRDAKNKKFYVFLGFWLGTSVSLRLENVRFLPSKLQGVVFFLPHLLFCIGILGKFDAAKV
jgi:hypothetical protein